MLISKRRWAAAIRRLRPRQRKVLGQVVGLAFSVVETGEIEQIGELIDGMSR